MNKTDLKAVPKDMPLMSPDEGVPLFWPYIPENTLAELTHTLSTRWIGQGPKVDLFEETVRTKFCPDQSAIAVGSGTDALHLAYLLSDIEEGDEVIAPVFTCTATNTPLLYQRAKIKFADVQKNTLNIDPKHVTELVTEKTKAIVCMDYGGLPCDMDELKAIANKYQIPIIEDAAQAIGGKYKDQYVGALSDFTVFSFQAIKHITTGDGGMLTMKDRSLDAKAKRLRWFGIDRSAKQMGVWENDIKEVGYKYQMTDIGASIALASMKSFDDVLKHRQSLLAAYTEGLKGVPGIEVVGSHYQDREHAAWICTVIAENRWDLQEKLRENHIESNQVHYRNDRYSIFGERRTDLPNMDAIEDKYLVLPIHHRVSFQNVQRICQVIRSGW